MPAALALTTVEFALRDALAAARLRSQTPTLSIQSRGNLKRVMRLDTDLTGWVSAVAVLEYLNAMGPKKRLLDHFPNAHLIGVTATPTRADGPVCWVDAEGPRAKIAGPSMADLERMGHLVREGAKASRWFERMDGKLHYYDQPRREYAVMVTVCDDTPENWTRAADLYNLFPTWK